MKQLYQRIEMDKTSKKKMKPSQNTTEVCHKIISNDCTHGEYVFEQKKRPVAITTSDQKKE